MKADFADCDLLIVLGTSLTVQPFASLVEQVGKDVPRLFINRTKPGKAGFLGMDDELRLNNYFKRFFDGNGGKYRLHAFDRQNHSSRL